MTNIYAHIIQPFVYRFVVVSKSGLEPERTNKDFNIANLNLMPHWSQCLFTNFNIYSFQGVCRTPKFRNYATALSGALLRRITLPFIVLENSTFFSYIAIKTSHPQMQSFISRLTKPNSLTRTLWRWRERPRVLQKLEKYQRTILKQIYQILPNYQQL